MKRFAKVARTIAVALTLGLASFGSLPVTAQDDEVNLQSAVDSTVRIRVPATDRQGTGWVIAAADDVNRAGAAVIVTSLNNIVLGGKIQVWETNGEGGAKSATILDTDPDRNLAFLEVKGIKARALPLSRTAPAVGRSVWAAGFNFSSDAAESDRDTANMASNASLQRGQLSRELQGLIAREARAPVYQLEHDTAMLPGFAGGPLIDHCGRLVGVNMRSGGEVPSIGDMVIIQGASLNYALKVDEVIRAANHAQVQPTFGESCDTKAAAAPVSTPTAVAPAPASTTSIVGNITKSPIFLVVLALLGLAAVAFGLFTLTRKDSGALDPSRLVPSAPIRDATPPSSRSPTETSTALIPESRTVERTLRLSGRGPAGEPINLSFGSGDLQAKPVTIGVGDNADAKIPDNRSDHKVSRLHARLGFDGVNFTIEDNKSLNRTFVRGRELAPHVAEALVHGDTIRLADVEIQASID